MSELSTSSIQEIVEQLKMDRFLDSTKRNYYGVWKNFNEFFIRLDVKPTSWEERIVLFVGYLVDKKKQSSTVLSYISAIKAVLANIGVKLNQDQFLLNSLTRACKFKNDVARAKLPIQKGMLGLMMRTLTVIYLKNANQPYLASLYKAMFSAAYHGLLRISEITTSPHCVAAKDVKISTNKEKILFILRSSKTHGRGDKPQLVKITGKSQTQQTHKRLAEDINPFILLNEYLIRRGHYESDDEQFFVFSDRSPVGPHQFRKVLFKTIKFIGLDCRL